MLSEPLHNKRGLDVGSGGEWENAEVSSGGCLEKKQKDGKKKQRERIEEGIESELNKDEKTWEWKSEKPPHLIKIHGAIHVLSLLHCWCLQLNLGTLFWSLQDSSSVLFCNRKSHGGGFHVICCCVSQRHQQLLGLHALGKSLLQIITLYSRLFG